MAGFCVDCWNKLMDTNLSPKKFILSKELDRCEECGKCKPVIVSIKRMYLLHEWFYERFKIAK